MAKKVYKKPEISKKQLEQELMEVNEALWKANQQLAAEKRAEDELISNLSHDLRASMSALLGAVELLKCRPEIEDESYFNLINLMERRLKLQKSMVDDLFFLTKLSGSESMLKKQKLECRALLEEYFYSTAAVPEYEACKLSLDIPEDMHCIVNVDAEAMFRVLDNLFSNAVKYSQLGVEILLEAKKQGNEVWVSVCDNGDGIAQEDLPRIFERTFRASKARTPNEGGSGLGLAIVKEIVKQHGGEIWCESRLGEGSRFTFTLPAEE